jgi:hypothetical protein
MDWTVDDAISKFVELSKEAFSPRRLLRVPGFKNAAQMFCSYRYESSGIEHALQKAFGTSHLFGQRKKATADQVKVGVIAAEQSSSKPYLFTNYARNHTPGKRSGMTSSYCLLN